MQSTIAQLLLLLAFFDGFETDFRTLSASSVSRPDLYLVWEKLRWILFSDSWKHWLIIKMILSRYETQEIQAETGCLSFYTQGAVTFYLSMLDL